MPIFGCIIWLILLSLDDFVYGPPGYLHCLRTFSRCCNSLFSNSSVEHMVLAPYIRALITLYFDARLWLLFHQRYRSVWVGFLYTFVVKVPSDWDVTKMSISGQIFRLTSLASYKNFKYCIVYDKALGILALQHLYSCKLFDQSFD